jgi:hypothetical protein
MENHQKFNYILEKYISASEVKRAFGFKSQAMISSMSRGQANIATLHIEGLEKHFDISCKIFAPYIQSHEEIDYEIERYRKEKEELIYKARLQKKILKKLEENQLIPEDIFNIELKLKNEFETLIKEHKEKLCRKTTAQAHHNFSHKVFPNNEKVFNNLKGVWYGYVYPSNPASSKDGIWVVETTINDDYSVVDYWGNRGYLKIGKNESLIIKESYDHDDLTIIRFSNRQVPSKHFHFVIISNQNHTLNEMVNFGFFSRKQYTPDEAKEILGDMESKQLKLDLEFNERLIERAIVPQ